MKEVYDSLNEKALSHVKNYRINGNISKNIVLTIIQLYKDVAYEKEYDDDSFISAYQMSVTPLFEFYLGRIFYHYFKEEYIKAIVYLRKQNKKCAPDIRIEQNGKTKFIIEVKIKGGWIQPFFSQERFENDIIKNNNNTRIFNPQTIIDKQNEQLNKYNEVFGNPVVFMLLPTSNMIHRQKYSATLNDYKKVFHNRTGLPKKNLVVLSSNLLLNLGNIKETDELEITNEFEYMFKIIRSKMRPTTAST